MPLSVALPEILLLETGGRPFLEVVFVAVCDAVLRALKGERRSPLPTSPSGSASARLAQNQTAEISSPDSGVGVRATQYLAPSIPSKVTSAGIAPILQRIYASLDPHPALKASIGWFSLESNARWKWANASSWAWPSSDLIHELMDDGIRDLGLGRMQPGESVVGYAGGQEIGRTVHHVDKVGGVDGTGKRCDTRSLVSTRTVFIPAVYATPNPATECACPIDHSWAGVRRLVVGVGADASVAFPPLGELMGPEENLACSIRPKQQPSSMCYPGSVWTTWGDVWTPFGKGRTFLGLDSD